MIILQANSEGNYKYLYVRLCFPSAIDHRERLCEYTQRISLSHILILKPLSVGIYVDIPSHHNTCH